MKPILIDSLHVCMGGGKVLLDYLCCNMLERKIDFVLLKDERCPKLSCEDKIKNVAIMPASISKRKDYYKQYKDAFSFVFCFGNIPAPIKMTCKVYTYVHNINLLKIPAEFPLKRKVINWLKQRFIASLADYTDGWIVQTVNTKECLLKALPYKDKEVLVLPFYRIPKCFRMQKDNVNREGYILVGNHTGTRGHDELIAAFRILKHRGVSPILHLTVSSDSSFVSEIEMARREGLQIVNHGIVPFDQLAEVYGHCKATVYPSINESLGLGILEAVEAGCDVIVSDLPFAHAICKPSEVFTSGSPESIADAILRYEEGESVKSELIIKDCLEDLLDLMTQKVCVL